MVNVTIVIPAKAEIQGTLSKRAAFASFAVMTLEETGYDVGGDGV